MFQFHRFTLSHQPSKRQSAPLSQPAPLLQPSTSYTPRYQSDVQCFLIFMSLSLRSWLIVGAALASVAIAQVDPDLTGTWTTKSRKVLTGPVGSYSSVL